MHLDWKPVNDRVPNIKVKVPVCWFPIKIHYGICKNGALHPDNGEISLSVFHDVYG